MPNTIGFKTEIANLPEGWEGSARDLLDFIQGNIDIRFDEEISTFQSGPTEPDTLNNRAWLKDGRIWMVPNEFGEWVPAAIDDGYKKIYVRPNNPFVGINPEPVEERAFWLQTNTAGNEVLALFTYLAGQWRTVYSRELEDEVAELRARLDTIVDEEGDVVEDRIQFADLTQNAREQLRKAALDSSFPVGTPYINFVNGGNPATLMNWPESSWVKEAEGRMLIGAGAGSGLTARTAGDTGGEESVQLTTGQLPSHTHNTTIRVNGSINNINTTSPAAEYNAKGASIGDTTARNGTVSTESSTTGSGESHNNMPPFLVVYIWRRVS